MSDYKKLFKQTLLSEGRDDLYGGRDDVYDDQDDEASFSGQLDDGGDYGVEGMPDVGGEISGYLEKYSVYFSQIQQRLLNPSDGNALLTKLAKISNIPEYANAAETVAKHVKKVVESIGATKTELETLVTLAEMRKTRRSEQEAGSESGKGGMF